MVRKRDGITDPEGTFDAVFPFNSDAGTDASRRYLAGIYKLSRLSYTAVLLCAAVLLASVFKAFNTSIVPVIIAWDSRELEFVFVPQRAPGTAKAPRPMEEKRFLEEAFVREYLERMFRVSVDAAANEANWCACERTLAFGAFNPLGRCFVCNFSANMVYETFAANLLPVLKAQSRPREIKIVDVRLTNTRTDPVPSGFAALMPGAKAERRVYSEYRIDFIAFGNERLSANISVVSGINNPAGHYFVDGTAFYFTPKARWRE